MTATDATPDTTATAWVRVDELQPHPANPKDHDIPRLQDAMRRLGFMDPLVVDQRTGLLIAGHGRREALQAMAADGEDAPAGVEVTDAGWWVPVYTGWASADDDEALTALVALNRLTETGGWHTQPLVELLDRLATLDAGMTGTGYDAGDLDALRARLQELEAPEPEPRPIRGPAEGSGKVTVWHGDCLEVMATLDADSVDAVVCDPPYGLAFMGKDWDRYTAPDFAAWCQQWATEALRVVKPGGHLVAFGGTRTHHRLMQGLEDAGWDLRDMGVWLYRSGFPKSLDVSKAIDRAAGADRPDRLVSEPAGNKVFSPSQSVLHPGTPVTDEAVEWQGWATALKPSIEPWVLARKPLQGTVAENVTRWGVGALNIDGTRHAARGQQQQQGAYDGASPVPITGSRDRDATYDADLGRWPANTVTLEDDEDLVHFRIAVGQAADYIKAQPGEKPWGAGGSTFNRRCRTCNLWAIDGTNPCTCDEPDWAPIGGSHGNRYVCAACDHGQYHASADGCPKCGGTLEDQRGSNELHPTVKPVALMRHLVRLVTPPGGTVLDPFAGTGTTGEAAILEGAHGLLVEREAAYLPLIARRTGADPTPWSD